MYRCLTLLIATLLFGCPAPGDDDDSSVADDDDAADDDDVADDDDTTGDTTTGSYQGGTTTITITGSGDDALDTSEHASPDGAGVWVFDYSQEGSPDDGPGLTLVWDEGGDQTYVLRSSEGDADEDGEWLTLVVELDGYGGPGDYQPGDSPPTASISFSWRGTYDPTYDYQPTFEISSAPDSDCEVTVEDDPHGGQLQCDGMYPRLDGGEWIASTYTLAAAWEAGDTIFR